EACRRVVLLEQMWSAIEKDWAQDKKATCPMWNEDTYPVALAVARGETPIYLDVPASERGGADQYPDPEQGPAGWIGCLRQLFPFLDLRLRAAEVASAAEQAAETVASTLDRQAANMRETARQLRGAVSSDLFHAALDAYSAHLLAKYGTKGYGRAQRNQ